MTVTLSPEHEALIRQKVASGLYASADAAIEAAIDLLDDHDRRRQRLLAALAEADVGDPVPYTADLLEAIDRDVDERLRRGDTPHPDVCP